MSNVQYIYIYTLIHSYCTLYISHIYRSYTTLHVAKDRTASSKLEKVNIVQRLQRRYRQAAMFFEQRMESVDSIIEIANSKGLSREKFLQLIEKKYPMAIA